MPRQSLSIALFNASRRLIRPMCLRASHSAAAGSLGAGVLLRQPGNHSLLQARTVPPPSRDPRLSPAGGRIWKRLALVLEVLGQIDGWLAVQARTGLTARDRQVLAPRLERLAREATSVAVQGREVLVEWSRA